MNLESRYDVRRARGWLAGLFGVVLVFGLVAGASGDLPKDRPARSGGSLGPSTIALGFAMDVNRVIMSLTDKGEIGAAFSSVSGGGAWRAITDQYIFSSGVNIGATVDRPGGGLDTLVFIGGPFSELRPGRLTPFESRSGATHPGSDLSVFWVSTDPAEKLGLTMSHTPPKAHSRSSQNARGGRCFVKSVANTLAHRGYV